MTSTGSASGCPPVASFSSRSLSGWRSVCAGCSVIPLADHDTVAGANAPATRLLLGRCLLLRGRLAGGGPLDRALGALLCQQLHGLFPCEFLQRGGTGNRDVGDAVGDVGPEPALLHHDVLLGYRVRAELRQRRHRGTGAALL